MIKLLLDTPGSQVNRKWLAEFGYKPWELLKLQLTSPITGSWDLKGCFKFKSLCSENFCLGVLLLNEKENKCGWERFKYRLDPIIWS